MKNILKRIGNFLNYHLGGLRGEDVFWEIDA